MLVTRREFILGGVATGATISLPSWIPTPRFAIVGLGQSGIYHLAAGTLPETCITSICDTNPQALNRAVKVWEGFSWHPLQVFSDYRCILDDPRVDVVVCATPARSRQRIIIDSLAAGKHIYCVPPFATSPEHGRELVRCAKAARRLLWQGSIDPIWDVACLARSLKSTLRDSGATLHLTRRLGIEAYNPQGWFEGLDLFARLTDGLPLQTASMPSPTTDVARVHFKLEGSALLKHVAVATFVDNGSGEEWDITLRSGRVSAEIWAGVVESKEPFSGRARTVASWHEFLHCLLQGTPPIWEEHYCRMLRTLVWSDRWAKQVQVIQEA